MIFEKAVVLCRKPIIIRKKEVVVVLTNLNWKNKSGTGERSCACGSWKKHWINFSGESWPNQCSVSGCTNAPTLGGHVINAAVNGEWIVPMCDSCNKKNAPFNIEVGITLVKANKSETCENLK